MEQARIGVTIAPQTLPRSFVPVFSETYRRALLQRNDNILIKTPKSGGAEFRDISSKEVHGLLVKAERVKILSRGPFVIVPKVTQHGNSPCILGPVVNAKHNAHERTSSYRKAISSLYRSDLSNAVGWFRN